MKQQALAHVSGLIDESMHEDALAWNRRQSGNRFLSMTMKVSRSTREVVLPLAAAQPMRLKVECDQCACRFAAVGAAFFCPGCGYNAADRVFSQSLNTVRAALEAVTAVRTSMSDADAAENTARTLIESGLQNAVMAFQRFAEALFTLQVQPPRARRNVFQNLTEGSALWATSFGNAYDAHLSKDEIGKLTQFFQQRHLLAHREGIVDEDYLARSGDTRYRAGQRIVVREDAVRLCVDLVEKLAAGMSRDAGNTQSRNK
ncbi:hypothetical protein [Hydrogenophaga palleronii]|uniref:hypothetical protein n=1 Tax=Hydrogenophaga palleronii TaxID=65655 RepID=UPI000B258179|nr:hypothetical protein [Hydrogenophaga palleronii]